VVLTGACGRFARSEEAESGERHDLDDRHIEDAALLAIHAAGRRSGQRGNGAPAGAVPWDNLLQPEGLKITDGFRNDRFGT